MRFSFKVNFLSSDGVKRIPTDYRRGIVSIFKQALENEDPSMLKDFYSDRKANNSKPFTFATYIPNVNTSVKKEICFEGDYIRVNFSSSSFPLTLSLYNGLLKIKEYPFYNYMIRVSDHIYENPIIIRENSLLFKTLTPVLLRDYKTNEKCYCVFNGKEQLYKDCLEGSIRSLVKEYLGFDTFPLSVNVVKATEIPLVIYNHYMTGIKGVYQIQSNPDVLQLLYDMGMGSRRSQGFGMLEIYEERRVC